MELGTPAHPFRSLINAMNLMYFSGWDHHKGPTSANNRHYVFKLSTGPGDVHLIDIENSKIAIVMNTASGGKYLSVTLTSDDPSKKAVVKAYRDYPDPKDYCSNRLSLYL